MSFYVIAAIYCYDFVSIYVLGHLASHRTMRVLKSARAASALLPRVVQSVLRIAKDRYFHGCMAQINEWTIFGDCWKILVMEK